MQQLTKKLNQVLAVVLTIVALMTGQQAWAQNPATIGSISYNSTLGAYEIANENNLHDLAVYVNGEGSYTTGGEETTRHDCAGLTFKVTGNIALAHNTDWNDATSDEDNFTPIGNYGATTPYKSFNGTFDGQGYTISGIRIYKPNDTRVGLFGYLSGATVKDVNLSDVRIRGNTIIGSIAGWVLNGGSISGCHVTNAFIAGLATTGGIAGSTYGNVSDCHASATVTIHIAGNAQFGTDSFGGIVGSLSKYASAETGISDCISSATLTVADGVNDYSRCGGIVGESSVTDGRGKISFENCIAAGVTIPASGSSGPVVGYIQNTNLTHNYYLNCTIGETVNVTNKGYGTLYGSGNTGYNDIKSLHVITFGPGLSGSGGIDVNGDTYYAAGSTVTLSGSTNGYTVTKDGTNPAEIVTVNESGGVYTFTMPATNVTVSGPPDYAGLWNADADHDGSSEEKAYIITTTAGLKLLADVVNTGNNQSGVFFKLGGNIEYTHTTDWNDATSTENNYTVIGNGGNRSFCGTFDGQGYTISGIRIYRDGKNYTGLFGDLNGGTVKNVRLADARITGSSNIGGIAGYNSQGTVMNCTVASDVCIHAAGENHGGIVGKNSSNTYDHKAIITACTSSAQLTVASGASGTPIRGGIVGYNSMSYAEVSNCLVLGASVLGWGDSENCKYLGAIVGNNSSGTLSNNYYSNCTVGNATTTANTNVGVGSNSGPGDVTDNEGARGIGRITLGTDVSKSGGTTVNVGSTTYYYAGSVITLSHSDRYGCIFDGYTAKDAADNDITASIISGSTLTMPAGDVTATANWKVPYIDVDGNTAYCTDFTELTGGDATSLDAGWYVVNSNISYTDRVTLDGDVTIILCDDKTMNIGTEGARLHHICIYGYQKSLTIYGQSGQTGALKTYNTSSSGISVSNYAQHGGNVTANANAGNAVSLYGGDFTLSRGTLETTTTGSSMFAISLSGTGHSVNMSGGTLTATSSNSIAIYADVNFTGGNLTATGGGSYNGISGNVTLSWSSLDDSFTCSKYLSNKSVTIANGKAFSNGEEVLRGTINSSDYATKLNGKTLTPVIEGTCGATGNESNVTWTYVVSSHTLTISGTGDMKSYTSADDQPWKDYRSNITSVVIENGVTSISNYAFQDCTNLATITLNGPATIDSDAFPSTATVTIADGLYLHNGTEVLSGNVTDMSKLNGKTLQVAIPYIDANGNTDYCTNFTVLDNTMTLTAGWYVVNSDVTFSGDLYTNVSSSGIVNIILCDGATLSANNLIPNANYDKLYIYGQSQGTGTASISGNMMATLGMVLYGGTINVTGDITCPQSGIGIFGGNVTAADINGYDGSHLLKGGIITVGSITIDHGNIILAGATVKANSYNVTNGNVTIADGITYYDGTGETYYDGNLDDYYIGEISGKTLRTYDYRTVEYVKADGTTATVVARPLKTGQLPTGCGTWSELPGGWYVVEDWNHNDEFEHDNFGADFYLNNEGTVRFNGDAHLILCDGAEMSVSNDKEHGTAIECSGTLTIYGQTGSSGKLSAIRTNDDDGNTPIVISTQDDFIINGGNINASINYGNCAILIESNKTTINGGTVNYTAPSNSTGIIGGLTFNGGKVTVNANIHSAVTLGWTNSSDFIKASSYYYCTTVTIVDGKSLTDGTTTYSSGTLTSDQKNDIAGKTLTPPTYDVTANQNPAKAGEYWSTFYHPTVSYQVGTGTTAYIATLNGSSLTLTEITDGIIPANTAVILKATSSNFDMTRTTTASTFNFSANSLLGGSTVVDGMEVYTLAAKNSVMGFYRFVGTALNPNKAHLEIDPYAARDFYSFDEEATEITTADFTDKAGSWYTLDGRKLQSVPTQKGMYIMNGRKVIIK